MWTVRVTGLPMSKGNLKCFGVGGRHRLTEAATPDKGEWRRRVTAAGEAIRAEIGQQLTGPVSMEITFTMPRPASVTVKARLWPTVKPDLDKLERLILDAFTDAGVWVDDAQVVEQTKRKCYPDTPAPDLTPEGGALIRIWRTET